MANAPWLYKHAADVTHIFKCIFAVTSARNQVACASVALQDPNIQMLMLFILIYPCFFHSGNGRN